MTDRVRPPFILAIAADNQGCGHHRCMMPLGSLAAAGVVEGRIDMGLWPDHVVEAAAPDVIVFQRQLDDGPLDVMDRWRKLLPNTLFIYELDDYLGEIPPASFHAGFMPPNIADKVARGVQICDRVTTTTGPMAEWLYSLGAKDVRMVPNALPVEKIRARDPRQSGKLRVGFAGGLSHSGDLRLIEPAMQAIGTEVEWVFFGMRPDGAKDVRIEFHEGMPPHNYLDKMAQLDVDVFLAPLEDNVFNRCKSNLRLVESGSVGACVIAQDLPTYHVDNPPVFAYANTPDEWTAAIRAFMASPVSERRKSADALRSWVGQRYVLERLLNKRMEAWLPDGEKWKPVNNVTSRTGHFMVNSQEDRESLQERLPFLRKGKFINASLEVACQEAIARGADLLWMRPATYIGEKSLNSVRAALAQSPEIATAVPVATDGVNSFPSTEKWMPMASQNVDEMENILRRVALKRKMSIVAPLGPCVLFSSTALAMLGAPDVEGAGSEEQAILEWGLRAGARTWKHMQAADAFVSSLAPPPQVQGNQNLRLEARGVMQQLRMPSEAFTPQERELIELELIGAFWGGPRPGALGFDAGYDSWKAIRAAEEWAKSGWQDRQDRLPTVDFVHFGDGSFIGSPEKWLLHIDDTVELDRDAMYGVALEIEKALRTNPMAEVIYFDNETKYIDNKVSPEFKPDFDLELFLAVDYVTQFCVVRGTKSFEDRAALFAHILDIALRDGVKAFVHVPRIFGSIKMQIRPEELAIDALQRQIAIQDRLGESVTVSAHKRVIGALSVVRDWRREDLIEPPLVSIIVPTLGSGRLIVPCINTIRQHTDYPNYEIIVVQNGDRAEPELGEDISRDPRVRVARWEGKFNWSAVNNWAIRFYSKGEFICCMNDDVNVSSKGWLDNMLGHAVLPDVGAVGARLIHPAGFVQHVGVVVHNGIAGHLHKGLPNGQFGHIGRAVLTHEATAVTGACMLFKGDVFDAVGGFNEDLDMNYNDTDFCVRLHERGLRNVVEMTAELLHPEGASRGDVMSADSLKRMSRENRTFAKLHSKPDPYWNPSLMIGLVHGGVMIQGLNAEVLMFDDLKPNKHQDRVLLVNDKPGIEGATIDVLRSGNVPMVADLSGFRLRMAGPILQNTPPWDLRDPTRLADGLRALGVKRIVIRSLIGTDGAAPPVETLLGFHELEDVSIQLDPIEYWMVMPVPGDEVQRRNFGAVDRTAWENAVRLFSPADTSFAEEAAE